MPEVVAAPSPALGEGATFPLVLALTSNVSVDLVEPETGTSLPMRATVPITIRNPDQLKRVQSNIAQLNFLHEWTDGMVLSLPEADGQAADAPATATETTAAPEMQPADATDAPATAPKAGKPKKGA